MKKTILFFILLIGCLSLQAQLVGSAVAFPKDSTTNTQTKYLTITTPRAINLDFAIGIYVIPVNKSGTQTASAIVQGSVDGTTFYDITNATADSVKLNTAGTIKTYGWQYTNAYWKYYRVKVVGYNTGVTTYTGGLILKSNK